MLIKFKLDDFYDIMDDMDRLLGYYDYEPTLELENCCLEIKKIRIVIPELKVSFREGSAWARNLDVENPDDDDAWYAEGDVTIQYDENENNYREIIASYNCDILSLAKDLCRSKQIKTEPGDLQCYIDTSEFISDDLLRRPQIEQ